MFWQKKGGRLAWIFFIFGFSIVFFEEPNLRPSQRNDGALSKGGTKKKPRRRGKGAILRRICEIENEMPGMVLISPHLLVPGRGRWRGCFFVFVFLGGVFSFPGGFLL